MNRFPIGKGIYLWQVITLIQRNPEYQTTADIAMALKNDGFEHVILKVADGIWNYNVSTDMVRFVTELKAQDLQVYGYQYIYNPSLKLTRDRTIKVGINRHNSLSLDGLIINAEKEWKVGSRDTNRIRASYVSSEYRRLLPDAFLAMSSFRYPITHHPEFPYEEFMSEFDMNMPQVYWMGSDDPVGQLVETKRQHDILFSEKPMLPTGFGFSEWSYTPHSSEIKAFFNAAKEMGFNGANFWEMMNAHDKLTKDGKNIYKVLKSLSWDGSSSPATNIDELIAEARNELIDELVSHLGTLRNG